MNFTSLGLLAMIENLFNICLERQAEEEDRKMIIPLIKCIPKLTSKWLDWQFPLDDGHLWPIACDLYSDWWEGQNWL